MKKKVIIAVFTIIVGISAVGIAWLNIPNDTTQVASGAVATSAPTEVPAAESAAVPEVTPASTTAPEVSGVADSDASLYLADYTDVEREEIKKILRERIKYGESESWPGLISFWLDTPEWGDGTRLGSILLADGHKLHSLDVTNDVVALERDGQPWLAVTLRPVVTYENNTFLSEDKAIEIMIPVTREANGAIALNEFYFDYLPRYDGYEDGYIKNNDFRVQLNMMKADLTHDGVEDYIETFIYLPAATDMSGDVNELAQQQIQYDNAFVRVYDGVEANSEKMAEPIWTGTYSVVHAGNGQVNLVNENGLYYLLESSVWEGQGSIAYSFKVFSLDSEGRKYIVEHGEIGSDTIGITSDEEYKTIMAERKLLVADFKEQLTPWLEGGIIIVATDVTDDIAMIATEKVQFTPQEFYDIVWKSYE